jgi:cytochrome c-type biogenesis protein CcmE
LAPSGDYVAREVLAKHDEKYMPPEVAKAVQRAGEQQHATTTLKD